MSMKHQHQHDQSKNNNGLVAIKQDLSNEISFSPAGNILVYVGCVGYDGGSFESTFKIWDLENDYHCLREWRQHSVHAAVFSPDGKFIASAGGSYETYDGEMLYDGGGAQPV
jgi:WD40 repeat protein